MTERTEQKSPRRVLIPILSIALGSLLVTLLVTIFDRDEATRAGITDVTYLLMNCLATAALFYAARRSLANSRKAARAWTILGLGQLFFVLGDLVWAVYEIVLQENPFPSLADVFYLAYYPFFMFGILLIVGKSRTKREKITHSLDIGVIMLASSLGIWNYLIGPAVMGNQDSWLATLLNMAYPIGDLLLCWALLRLLYSPAEDENPWVIVSLAGSLVAMIISDSIFSYQSLAGTYVSGGLFEFGWLVSYLLTCVAGLLHAVFVSGPGAKSAPAKKGNGDLINRALDYFPYAWVIIAFAMLIASHYSPQAIEFDILSIGVGMIILMVLLRQILALADNHGLNLELMRSLKRMQQQADELERANRHLLVEVNERKHAEEQLSHDALHDALTGLANRTLFTDRLEHAIDSHNRRSDYSYAVLFLDLDHFKVINDSLGHHTGDELLIAVGQRLRESLRSIDTIARMGGDEFVILLDNTPRESVSQIVERTLKIIKTPFRLDVHDVFVTASVGVVVNTDGYADTSEILRDADIAMYEAKTKGRDCFEYFDPSMRAQAITRLDLENDLRRAIEENWFVLYYQPILSLDNDALIGFEALIRLNHPERGLISPAEFLPVSEETGLIIPIGRWVLGEACRQMQLWHQQYPEQKGLSVSVNISSKQLAQPDFLEMVRSVLENTGLDAHTLKLEITESVIIDFPERVTTLFNELEKLSIKVEIDDFGTGYSSLGYLQHFPIHTIKIDKSFVAEISRSQKGLELIRTMILMARELGMNVIAEGIETVEQLNKLKQLECRYGQGYLLSRPMDSYQAGKVLKHRRPFSSEQVQNALQIPDGIL
ncbi:MAG: EAL domain-containing protein [Chloroflexi bacterium]|nr:EAL domain-containing protein [Chloroflexota bacterium]